MSVRLQRVTDSLRTGFWAIPTLCVVLALAAAPGAVEVDRALDDGLGRFTFGAGPDGAREVLSAITTSMITFTGLVFSITIVVLQLTSSQFSPRVLRTFLRDRQTQVSLGVFIATFVYAVMVLRTVDSTESTRFVPAFATSVGVALLLVSVGVFVGYIHHVATAIQVSSVVRAIGQETREGIERRFPVEREPSTHAPLPLELPVGRELAAPALRRRHVRRHRGAGHGRPADRHPAARHRAARRVRARRAPLSCRCSGPTATTSTRTRWSPPSPWPRTARWCRTSPSGCGSSSTSPSGRCRRASTTRRRRCSRSTSCTTCCAGWPSGPTPTASTPTPTGWCGVLTPPERFADHLALALDEVEQYGDGVLQVERRVDALLADLESAARPEHRDAVVDRRRARAARPRDPA